MSSPASPLTRARRAFWTVLVAALGVILLRGPGAPARFFPPGHAVVEWRTANGPGSAHWAPLTDITPDNVPYLEVAWTYRTGDVAAHEDGHAGTAFESTPIMVDGLLYVVTPFSRAVALDAETGREIWTFDPGLDRSDAHHGSVTARGLSYWADAAGDTTAACARRILLPVFDGRLFALDARTGRRCRDFANGGELDLGDGVARIQGRRDQYKETAPPAVVGDVVVVGSSIFDGHFADAPSGVVRGFDVRTGALRWSWEPLVGVGGTAPDGRRIPAGAANTWATITADPELDLVFVPTGSPSPDHYGGLRPGDNRYGNSLVALRASTGEVVWSFQIVHHDLWDYDLPSPPALITLERDGRAVPAVVQSTKTGHLFVFNRETGEPLFPIVERPVPPSDVPGEVASPTQPVPLLPRPLTPQHVGPEDAWGLTPLDRDACRERLTAMRHGGVFTPPSLHGTVASPGFIGGMEWGGVGYDPDSALLIVNTNRLPMFVTLIPRDRAVPSTAGDEFSTAMQTPAPYAARRGPILSPLGIPCTRPPWGMIHAVDMRTGEVAWERPLGTVRDLTHVPTPAAWGSPNLGGPLVTGGVVFMGATMDRTLRAFDVRTGELLWKDRLPASVNSSPMTYRAHAGSRQLVVVTAGGHDAMKSALGDYVVAYALPTPGSPGGRP